jgi:hypothetical protein
LSQKGTGKELRIVTKPVVTEEAVIKDPKKLKLLHIIDNVKEISEKALIYLLYWLKTDKEKDLGYNFIIVGDIPNSKELREDIHVLLYLGLLEADPRTRKLKLTSAGKEFLEKHGIPKEELEDTYKDLEDLKPKINAIDVAVEMMLRSMGGGRRRRRKRR